MDNPQRLYRWWTCGAGKLGMLDAYFIKAGPITFAVYRWLDRRWHFEAHCIGRRVYPTNLDHLQHPPTGPTDRVKRSGQQ